MANTGTASVLKATSVQSPIGVVDMSKAACATLLGGVDPNLGVGALAASNSHGKLCRNVAIDMSVAIKRRIRKKGEQIPGMLFWLFYIPDFDRGV